MDPAAQHIQDGKTVATAGRVPSTKAVGVAANLLGYLFPRHVRVWAVV